MDGGGDFGGRTVVRDVELACGAFGGLFESESAAAGGGVNIFAAGAGVAAGFGVAAGADVRDAEGEEAVAKAGGFAGGEDEADVGKTNSKGADELGEFAVGELGEGLEFAGVRAEAREGNGDLSFPTMAQEIRGVRGEGDGFAAPIAQAVEGADAEASETGGVGAFGGFEAPIEIAFGAGGVDLFVNGAVVGLLINDEAFAAGGADWFVIGGFHGADFEGDAGRFVAEGGDAIAQVIIGNEFWMFAGDEEDVAETLGDEGAGFADDFIDAQSDAKNGVVPGEAAVFAIVDAFVRDVERREKTDGFAEALEGELARALAESFQLKGGGGAQQRGEAAEVTGRAVEIGERVAFRDALRKQCVDRQLVELGDKTHPCLNSKGLARQIKFGFAAGSG